jgi:GxxExxY protein
MLMLHLEELTEAIIGAAIEVHRHLGPGLLESAYEQCLCHELTARNISFKRQVEMPVQYKGALVDCGYRIDILVEDAVILELKAVDKIIPIHEAQVMTYMKLSGKKVGILMNFNTRMMKDGIVRRAL